MADQIDIDNLVDELRNLIRIQSSLGGTGTTGGGGGGGGGAELTKGFDRVVRALGKLGGQLDQSATTQRQRDRSTEEFIRQVDGAVDAAEALTNAAADAAKAAANYAAEQAEAQRLAARTAEEISEEEKKAQQKRLRQMLDDMRGERMDTRNIAAMIAREKVAEAEEARSLQVKFEKLGNLISDKLGTDVVKTQIAMVHLHRSAVHLVDGFKQFADVGATFGKTLLDIGDANKGFTQFNSLIDGVTSALGEMAKAIPIAGEAISGAMKMAAEGAKFVLDQLQKTATAFNELGNTGALTAEGMSGLQRQFLESGMTLDGYKKTIQENSKDLAAFGGTVGEGAKRFSKFTGDIVDSDAGLALRRLGFSADQIGETAAAFVSQQTRLGLAQRKSNDQLTQGAIQYTRELDALTKLTGMQRKDIEKQQEVALGEARFRAKYDEMVAMGQEKQAKAMLDFQTMVNNQAPEMAAGLRDMATGLVNSEAAQKVFADTGGAAAGIMERLKAGQIDQVQAYKELQAATLANMATSRENAMAMGNQAGVFTDYAQKSNFLNSTINELGQVVSTQNKQMTKGQDPLTDSTVAAQQAMDQMSRQIQNFAFNAMPAASKAVETFTTTLNTFIGEVSKQLGVPLKDLGGNVAQASNTLTKVPTAADTAITAAQVALNPQQLLADQQSRAEKLAKQDEANWKQATLTEKASVATAKTVENLGDALGDLVGFVGAEGIGKRIKAAAGAAREERIATDTEYLRRQGRLPEQPPVAPGQPPAAGAPAAPAVPGQPPAAPGAAVRAGQQDLAAMGLRIKQGDVQAQGATISPKLIELARSIQSSVPGFAYFSGFNDRFHQENAPGSRHTSGLAADFALSSVPTREQGAAIVSQLKGMGASVVIDEYNNPSAKSTAGHFHVEVPAAARGMPRTSGMTLAGEAGPEAIIPLPDGRNVPVKMIGLGTDFKVSDIKTAAVILPGLTESLSSLVNELKNRPANSDSSIAGAIATLRNDLQQFVQNLQGGTGGRSDVLLEELVGLQRRLNSTSEKILQVSVN